MFCTFYYDIQHLNFCRIGVVRVSKKSWVALQKWLCLQESYTFSPSVSPTTVFCKLLDIGIPAECRSTEFIDTLPTQKALLTREIQESVLLSLITVDQKVTESSNGSFAQTVFLFLCLYSSARRGKSTVHMISASLSHLRCFTSSSAVVTGCYFHS